ncbi:unnamed protein product [Closterium sp. Naga37s-1]|nr:unnamed protein product [Closterium sp. Naga37s-1]
MPAKTRALTHGAVVGSPTSRYFPTTRSASFAASSASGASSPWSSSSATNAAHGAATHFTRIHSHPPRRESIPSLLSPWAAPALTSAFTASDQSMQFRKRAYDQQTDFSPNVWSGRGASSVSLRQPRAFLGIFSPVVAAIVAAFAAVFVVGAALKAVVAITFAMVAVSVILPIAFFVLLFSLPLFIPAIQLGIAAAVGTAGAAFALIATILGAAWSLGLLNRGSSSRSSGKAGRGGRRGKRGKRSSDFESEMMDYLELSPKEREKMKKALNKLGVRRWFNGASSEDNEWKKWVDYIECSEDEEDSDDERRTRGRRDAGGETETIFMSNDNKRDGSKKGSGSGTGVWLEEEERKRMKKFDEKLIEKSVRKMGDPSSWSVDQVASWLELQGFGAYADTFKEQRVCGGVCPPLLLSLTISSSLQFAAVSPHPSAIHFVPTALRPSLASPFLTKATHPVPPALPPVHLPFPPPLPTPSSPTPLRRFPISGGHPAVYIVRLHSAPAIPAYVGGIPGFPATASPAVVAEAAAVAAARGNEKRVKPHAMTSAADAEENDELDDDDYNGDDGDNYGDDNDGNAELDVPAMAGIRVSVKPRTNTGGGVGKEVLRGPVPATRGVRVNVQAAHVKAFARMLVRQQQQVVAETRLSERNMLYSYKFAANGFAARLTQADVRRLKRHAMVADVTRSYGVRSATTYTPRFLQLPGSMWASSGGGSRAGEGVVIGVVDTGIWPEHPSFRVANSSHVYPLPPRRWAGKCVRTRDFPASRCTRKLVGARFFSRAYEAQGGVVDTQYDFRSPRDADGHGTWCAGTAAGTGGTPVLTSERPPVRSLGIASGMAPGAHLAVYKVLWTNATLAGYGELADVHYAIDRAIKDGVDVLSLSLGGLGPDQHYFDDLLYLLANQAGMVVVTAAGNQGPAPNLGLWNRFGIYRTISNFSPFYLTVGASSIGRRFLTELRLGSGRVVYASGVGSGTYTTRHLPLLSAVDAARPDSSLEGATHCLPESLSPARARGAIILCTRGMVGVQDKLRSVAAAGGVAMILANEDGGLIDLNTLSATAGAPIPFIHVTLAQARIVRAYIQSTPKPIATIMARCHVLENAAPPMIAPFSSTGPTVNPRFGATAPYPTNDILKPDVVAPGVDIWAAWTGQRRSPISPMAVVRPRREEVRSGGADGDAGRGRSAGDCRRCSQCLESPGVYRGGL